MPYLIFDETVAQGAYSTADVYKDIVEREDTENPFGSNPYFRNGGDYYNAFIKKTYYMNSVPHADISKGELDSVFTWLLLKYAYGEDGLQAERALKFTLCLMALGLDPNYAGRHPDTGENLLSAYQLIKSQTPKNEEEKREWIDSEELVDVRLIAEKKLQEVSDKTLKTLPYELLRTAIYFEIHNASDPAKQMALRSAMKELDSRFNPEASSVENYEYLRADLENHHSLLYKALSSLQEPAAVVSSAAAGFFAADRVSSIGKVTALKEKINGVLAAAPTSGPRAA